MILNDTLCINTRRCVYLPFDGVYYDVFGLIGGRLRHARKSILQMIPQVVLLPF